MATTGKEKGTGVITGAIEIESLPETGDMTEIGTDRHGMSKAQRVEFLSVRCPILVHLADEWLLGMEDVEIVNDHVPPAGVGISAFHNSVYPSSAIFLGAIMNHNNIFLVGQLRRPSIPLTTC